MCGNDIYPVCLPLYFGLIGFVTGICGQQRFEFGVAVLPHSSFFGSILDVGDARIVHSVVEGYLSNK